MATKEQPKTTVIFSKDEILTLIFKLNKWESGEIHKIDLNITKMFLQHKLGELD